MAEQEGSPKWECDPNWLEWVNSLDHVGYSGDSTKRGVTCLRDMIEQIMYDAIVYGGDMGPNGNDYEGIDEGMVMTNSMIDGYETTIRELLDR